MDVLKQLLGRLHPLIVHLPIGFIILGLLLQWYDRKRLEYQNVIPLVFLWGAICATLACITGYLQYIGEGYAFDTVKWHLWSGIVTALFAFLTYIKLKGFKPFYILIKIPVFTFSAVLLLLISFTGHQGGSITHGEDYLVEPLPNSIKSVLGFETFEEMKIALNEDTWEDALIYDDVVKPILNNKCVSCHNPRKNKGELLLHTEEGIVKGGENGKVVVVENALKSELFVRMNLPLEDEGHMPPEGKKQPTKEEITLLGSWIDAGLPFEGSIRDSGLEKALFLSFFPKRHDSDYPNLEIAKASQDSITVIEKRGIYIDPISKSSNFLSVSAINNPAFEDDDLKTLFPIKAQIARLDLGGTKVTDAIFEQLALFPNLTILKLDNTSVTGKNIEALSSLEHLKSINLIDTAYEESYLGAFSDFKVLQKIYLYNTKIEASGVQTLNDGQITIDYGNYELPQLPSDSIIY